MGKKRGNGEGSIYFSEKLNRWVGQFTAGRKDNGKLNRKSVYGKTRKEVKEKITNALAEVQMDTYIEKNDITLLEIIVLKINEHFKANKIRESTFKRNMDTKKIVASLPIANMAIQKITRSNINNSLIHLTDYSNSTIDKVYALIRQAFNYATLNDIIQKDFFTMRGAIIKPISKKRDKEVEALEVDEQNRLLEQLEKGYDTYTDIIYIALFTGMRIGEILTLKGTDIDFDRKLIFVTKTLTKDKNDKPVLGRTTKTDSGVREVPILDGLQPILEKYKNKRGFLFEYNDHYISTSTINAHFKRLCKNANIKVINTKKKKSNGKIVNLKSSRVNTHMLRHTFATRCIEAGVSPIVLQKYFGHKDIQVTLNTYASVFNSFKDQELEKIESYLGQLH